MCTFWSCSTFMNIPRKPFKNLLVIRKGTRRCVYGHLRVLRCRRVGCGPSRLSVASDLYIYPSSWSCLHCGFPQIIFNTDRPSEFYIFWFVNRQFQHLQILVLVIHVGQSMTVPA